MPREEQLFRIEINRMPLSPLDLTLNVTTETHVFRNNTKILVNSKKTKTNGMERGNSNRKKNIIELFRLKSQMKKSDASKKKLIDNGNSNKI